MLYFPAGDGEFLSNVSIPAHQNRELSPKNINNINFSYKFLMAVWWQCRVHISLAVWWECRVHISLQRTYL